MKVSVLFSFLRQDHRSHLWTHPHAQYVIIRRSGQGSAFWWLERRNLKSDSSFPSPKKVKIGTLSWRSMENCSHPNSGMVSGIQFKLSTGIEHQVASRDMIPRSKVQRSRSQRHVTYQIKNCNNSGGTGGPIKFILGA